MDLEPDGAWQVDAAKLGASADIFFTVALEAPINYSTQNWHAALHCRMQT